MGFTDAQGFFLYGRVAYLADCDEMKLKPEQRPLCQPEEERVNDPGVYIWDPVSPARTMFPGWAATADQQHANDQFIGAFAREVIRARTRAYLELVLRDFSYFFTPGANPWRSEASLLLPAAGALNPDPGPAGREYWPGYQNTSRAPADALNAYWNVFHTPRWALAIAAVAALLFLLQGLLRVTRRSRVDWPGWGAVALMWAMAMSMLLAAAATAQFGLRYAVSNAPLLFAAGALAADALLPRRGAAQPARELSRASSSVRPAGEPIS